MHQWFTKHYCGVPAVACQPSGVASCLTTSRMAATNSPIDTELMGALGSTEKQGKISPWDLGFHTCGYFRLIRARTERFDLRYDSGVWFGGMIRGMIRGYDSRRRKPSYQHWPGIEPWA